MPVPVSPERVVEFFKKSGGRPLKAKDVGKALGLTADDRGVVRHALSELTSQGVLVQLEGRRYVLAGASNAHKGSVQRKATGSGWFIPDDPRVGDAFLPPQEMLGVVDGDRVLCQLDRAPRGPVGRVLRVLEHRRTTLTGLLQDSGRARWVDADDNVLSGPVIIPPGSEGNADALAPGEVVEVLLVEYPTAVTAAVGRVIRSLGKRGKIDVEIERILAEKRIVKAFPPDVDEQAEAFPVDPTPADFEGRVDLREMALVTIDGETAKDFDDAVFAIERGKDVYVTVAIADVSHYVRAGTPLDVEAARRGTSIYYPGKVIPMLPEALSNGLCSLKPRVNRLCLVAEFAVRPDGSMHQFKFYDAVMNSHARLTYTLAQKFYDGDAEARSTLSAEVQASLMSLLEASRRLRAQRAARGALDFDLPETLIALDDKGEPVRIHPLERLNAHRLIEDLMVAANEAVAQRFEERAWPCIYRIHEAPDPEKLDRFKRLAQLLAGRRLTELEVGRDGRVTSNGLMAVMKQLGDNPARRALDSLLLRSMMQAKYSADNVGHYGLGSEAYLHFTSPIRRYPDLVVHRLLKDRLHKKKRKLDEDALLALLDDIAGTSSGCERVATDIERAVDALYAAWFMKDRVGEVFDGVVQGVAEFGLFVQLEGAFVEGMVRVSDLGRDYFVFDEVRLRLVGERSGVTYTVGDALRVKVASVDLARRQIGLVPEDMEERALPRARLRRDEEAADDLAERGSSDRRESRRARSYRQRQEASGRPEEDGRGAKTRRKRAEDRGSKPARRGANVENRGERKERRSAKEEQPSAKSGARGRGSDRDRDTPRGRERAEAPEATGSRPRIRGPEDLRRIFEERSKKGRSDDGPRRGPRNGGKKKGR